VEPALVVGGFRHELARIVPGSQGKQPRRGRVEVLRQMKCWICATALLSALGCLDTASG